MPMVDFSRSEPRALKKKDTIVWSFKDLRELVRANFIKVDFPVPDLPFIHKKP